MSLVTSAAAAAAMQNKGIEKTSASGNGKGGFTQTLKEKLGAPAYMEQIFDEASRIYGVSKNLIRAVSKAESSFNPKAVSGAGAMGVMQLMPGTASALGVSDPFDPRQNIMGGTKYLRENLERFDGNVDLALAAYNAGPGSVEKYNGIPPYEETQNYVKRVKSYMGDETVYMTASATGQSGTGADYDGDLYVKAMMSSYSPFSLSGLSLEGIEEDGETVTMSKESFASLIELLRIQMIMNAQNDVGNLLT